MGVSYRYLIPVTERQPEGVRENVLRIRPVRLQSAGLGGMLLNGGTND